MMNEATGQAAGTRGERHEAGAVACGVLAVLAAYLLRVGSFPDPLTVVGALVGLAALAGGVRLLLLPAGRRPGFMLVPLVLSMIAVLAFLGIAVFGG